jgi:aminoglycoside phosphotransferase (APT) family kinase protein
MTTPDTTSASPALNEALLAHLRAYLDAPHLAYREAPAAITGGYDTRIFAFRLEASPDAWSGPLILRLLGAHHDPKRVLFERVVHDALTEASYPAPRVLMSCDDAAPLDGAFLIMERLPGKPLPEARPFGMGNTLANLQARLHALNPAPLERALNDIGAARVTLGDHLAELRERMSALPQDHTFAPALEWLLKNRPLDRQPPVICHGDFHPFNIIVDGDDAGVIDWPGALIAEPAFDVGGTLTILRLAPMPDEMPALLRRFAGVARSLLARRYLGAYRKQRPLDTTRLPYFEALRCFSALLFADENTTRTEAGAEPPPNPWAAPGINRNVRRRFHHLTGIPL